MKKLISVTLVAGLTFGLAASLTGCPNQGGTGGTSPSPTTSPAASPSPS